ncbi:hypothetical protein GGF46_002081 [Coemansia sp. RSA 552]|nr:hypothetical protein GGF46_002081 [Coemansia sp. RSA 552]
MTERTYDIVLWGATGFTGALVLEYLAIHAPTGARVAVGDRDKADLENLCDELAAKHPRAAARLREMDMLTGNSLSAEDMHRIAAQTRVVATAVGPYVLYGEQLVRACIDEKTHYCDVTGEIAWIYKLHEELNDQAVRNGVCISTLCGFDCVPPDLGCLMLAEYARKELNEPLLHVQGSVTGMRAGLSGGTIITMASMMKIRLGWLWKRVTGQVITNMPRMPAPKPNGKESNRAIVHYNREMKRWQTVWLMYSMDTATANWAGRVLEYGPGFSYSVWMCARNMIHAVGWALGLLLGSILVVIGFTRRLLYTFGILPRPGGGPSKAFMDSGYFALHLKGYTETGVIYGKVSCSCDPGYRGTARIFGESALCLAFDRDKSFRPGIYPPSVTMGTTLLKRLRLRGWQFDVGPAPIPTVRQNRGSEKYWQFGIDAKNPDGKDNALIAGCAAVYGITGIMVIYAWCNYNYRPIRVKNLPWVTLIYLSAVLWFVGNCGANGHVWVSGAFVHCKAFVIWLRVLFCYTYAALNFVRFYALDSVFNQKRPFGRRSSIIAGVVAVLFSIVFCLATQLISDNKTVAYVESIATCNVTQEFRIAALVIQWVIWVGCAVLIFRLRNIQSSFNEFYESLAIFALIVGLLIESTVTYLYYKYYTLEQPRRFQKTIMDMLVSNMTIWIILGYPIAASLFWRKAYEQKWIERLANDNNKTAYDFTSNQQGTTYAKMNENNDSVFNTSQLNLDGNETFNSEFADDRASEFVDPGSLRTDTTANETRDNQDLPIALRTNLHIRRPMLNNPSMFVSSNIGQRSGGRTML